MEFRSIELAPVVASALAGVVISAATIFGVTAFAENDVRPESVPRLPQSSVLNQVEYGSR